MVSACSVSINCQVNKRYDQSVWCQNMFGSCWKFLCNNSVLTKSANYKNKNNKHLCTKYKCIQIFQNLYIFGNRFWKKRWEKTVQSIIDGAKTEHYYSASVLFCIVYITLLGSGSKSPKDKNGFIRKKSNEIHIIRGKNPVSHFGAILEAIWQYRCFGQFRYSRSFKVYNLRASVSVLQKYQFFTLILIVEVQFYSRSKVMGR